MVRIIFFLVVLSSVIVLVALPCTAEVTRQYNGLTLEQVKGVLGTPDYQQSYDLLGITDLYYKGLRITLTDGVVSECEFYRTVSAVTSSAQKMIPPFQTVASTASYKPKPFTLPKSSLLLTSLKYLGYEEPDTKESVYLGRLSTNIYDSESISNRYGTYGNPYGNTLANPYSIYGSKYSDKSWSNPYATNAPRIYAEDGTYLGKLSANRYDPESISNPYGRYGSKYGNNLMNPYSIYGSRYSSQSWKNPYTTTAPKVYSISPYSMPELSLIRGLTNVLE